MNSSMDKTIEEQIEEVLDQVRPALHMDGGGIEFVKYEADAGRVHVRFQGACVGCPMSEITLKMGVESALCESISEIKEVIAVE